MLKSLEHDKEEFINPQTGIHSPKNQQKPKEEQKKKERREGKKGRKGKKKKTTK